MLHVRLIDGRGYSIPRDDWRLLMGGSFKIGRFSAIDVRVHWTFLLLVAFFAFVGYQTSGTLAGALTPTAAMRLGLTSELVPQSAISEAHVLPVIGEIAAGGPIEAYQDATETMAIPDVLAPGGDAYVLRVRGDSMIEAHIADGDFVLIRPQSTARNGDIVVAQVEENAVTLKRFFKEKDRIRLQPANDKYPPQFYDDVRIQGKLIGVIRRLD